MRKTVTILVAVFALLLLLAPAALAEGMYIHAFAGEKDFNDSVTNNAMDEVGVEVILGSFTVGYHTVDEDGQSVSELSLGGTNIWMKDGIFHPFLGLGLTGVSVDTGADTGSGIGLWASFGGFFTIAEILDIGIQARYSTADVEVLYYTGAGWATEDVDFGGTHIGVIAGVHF